MGLLLAVFASRAKKKGRKLLPNDGRPTARALVVHVRDYCDADVALSLQR